MERAVRERTLLLQVLAAVLLLNMLVDLRSRVQALAGIGLILLGIPAWAHLRRRPAQAQTHLRQYTVASSGGAWT